MEERRSQSPKKVVNSGIKENVVSLLKELPEGVELVAAAKERKPEEILEAVKAGVRIIGENYIGEAKRVYAVVGKEAKWHFIGLPERQKHGFLRPSVLKMFDMIETIGSFEIAKAVNEKCASIGKVMPILVEINSGKEPQKYGVLPESTVELVEKISQLRNIKVVGLMTMGPRVGNPEEARPYFVATREIFDGLEKLDWPNVRMKYLSMGMSNSWRIAVQEGANMVRIGTGIFGKRD